MRNVIISYDVPRAWETWIIELHDDEVKESDITPEWLLANPEKWEYFDLKDRGSDGMENLIVEYVY